MTAHDVSLCSRLLAFIRGIGLRADAEALPAGTFLPGLHIDRGRLCYDAARLRHPGDLLHEAGHLAVVPPAQRAVLTAPLDPHDAGSEMMALAWSFAAAVHLGLPLAVVFHADGYKGDAQMLIHHYTHTPGIGIPLLQWAGMTYDAERAREAGAQPFPHMRCWLRP